MISEPEEPTGWLNRAKLFIRTFFVHLRDMGRAIEGGWLAKDRLDFKAVEGRNLIKNGRCGRRPQ